LQSIVSQAGWPIWFLVLLSVATLAIIIERALSLRVSIVAPTDLLDQVLQLVQSGGVTAQAILKLSKANPLGAVLAELLKKRKLDATLRRRAVEDIGREQAHVLNKFLPALAMMASIAPLMGLFGTVVGMIEIFASYRPDGADPAQLARGISVALYNTGFGILIAIPALIAHRYFKSKTTSLILQMERAARQLEDALPHRERSSRDAV
jgi:biopolymer transport protein ExbB